MRQLAVFGSDGELPQLDPADIVVMDGVRLRVGLIEGAPPAFDRNTPANAHAVLVRIKAFSLNYRDKYRIFAAGLKAAPDSYYIIGSEFAGEVLETGPQVTRFAPGDRVMGNNAYPDSGMAGARPGLPTNHGSKELQILHEAKLVKMPGNMSYEVAAAFSVGAQTTYSMLRRTGVTAGSLVLVTSAKSNTSLFAINAARGRRATVYATSTSAAFQAELHKLGVTELAVIPNGDSFQGNEAIKAVVAETQGFDVVIDPYFDLHFVRSLDILKIGGRYVSCGVYDQYLDLIGKARTAPVNGGGEFLKIMLKNISVIGNCIGLEQDLLDACRDYAAGSLPVVIDSVFTGDDVTGFFDRTYVARDRFGKVVYRYD